MRLRFKSTKIPTKSTKNTNQAPILLLIEAINEKPSSAQRELVNETGLSLNMVKYYMQKMQENGSLIREGSSQKGKWIIKK